MTDLRLAAEQYLGTRRALGFKLSVYGRLLASFIDDLEQAGLEHITSEHALAWATRPHQADPRWHSRRLGVVRGFARHVRASDPASEVPPVGLLLTRPTRTTPYLYSPEEITALLQAAGRRRVRMAAATYQTMIGLLVVTGMRVGEACRLDRSDVDLDTAVLTITASKFGKSRQVPVHPTTVAALRGYAQERDQRCPHPSTPSFFVSALGTRPQVGNVCETFTMIAHDAGVHPPASQRRVRIHHLRHSFAVTTLLRWYHADLDIQARLPLLSTYLGHVNPVSTYWYLQAAPELLALAARRLEHGGEGAS